MSRSVCKSNAFQSFTPHMWQWGVGPFQNNFLFRILWNVQIFTENPISPNPILIFPRNDMKCPELHIPCFATLPCGARRTGLGANSLKTFVMEIQWNVELLFFYSPTSIGSLDKIYCKNILLKLHDMALILAASIPCGRAFGHITKYECLIVIVWNVQNSMKLIFTNSPHYQRCLGGWGTVHKIMYQAQKC